VVECAGVGYLARIPVSTYEKLPPVGGECELLTHLHVREDAMELYGFATEAERSMFRRLIAVAGVGPAVAMALMSRHSVAEVLAAIRRADAKLLQRAKGVGRKTAERIALELRGAVDELESLIGGAAAAPGEAPSDAESAVAQALATLGYSERDADGLARAAVESLGVEAELGELVREALKRVR
jgi:Holliday junction DNA helicase RuvA